jgi:hypothetical protein
LATAFLKTFQTNHKIVTTALAQSWSLPDAMISAYQYRASPEQGEDGVLGRVLAAATAAVASIEAEEGLQPDLGCHAEAVGLAEEDLQRMAVLGDRQMGKVQSLASNMTG